MEREDKENFSKNLFMGRNKEWKIYVTYENEKEIYDSKIYEKLDIYKIYDK